MKTIAPQPESEDQLPYRRLSAHEAQQLRQEQPSISPWWVIAGQVAMGLVAAVAAWVLTGKQNVGWSVAYGALAVVIPAAVFARGLTGRLSSHNAGTAAFGFMVWEMVKIALSIAMLVIAPRWVSDLSWPALLVGLVLTMKVYWIALAFAPKRKTKN